MGKVLIKSNKYLKTAAKRIDMLEKNISSSSAIEGISVARDAATGRFMQKKSAAKPVVTDSATKSSAARR